MLAKPGRLDAAEWQLTRTHSAIGEALTQRVAGLSDAAGAVRHHHERYDGGYPDELASEGIPIEARIVAAADAYSAMTCDRVYCPARSREEAVVELEASAGSHLDPAVVAALGRVLASSPGASCFVARCPHPGEMRLGDPDPIGRCARSLGWVSVVQEGRSAAGHATASAGTFSRRRFLERAGAGVAVLGGRNIIVSMQENRSFDHYYGFAPQVQAAGFGPGPGYE